jgi:hypothetical protein
VITEIQREVGLFNGDLAPSQRQIPRQNVSESETDTHGMFCDNINARRMESTNEPLEAFGKAIKIVPLTSTFERK